MITRIKFCIILSLWIVLVCSPLPAHSAARYISTDHIEVMVRTGPGTDHKIVAMPRSGMHVEVLEEEATGWIKVRLPNNKEGWMVGRYLSETKPAVEVVSELKAENRGLRQQVETLTEEKAHLIHELENLQDTLGKQTRTSELLKESYQNAREKDPEFKALKDAHGALSERLDKVTRREAELKEKVKDLEKGSYLKWFVAGAGVLLAGFLLGFRTRRSKRRPSLL